MASRDDHPWDHPFLSAANLSHFRDFSDRVAAEALDYASQQSRRLDCAFSVNLAQSMYKWARLAQIYGADATLYCHSLDTSALGRPEWEDFDGEYPDIFDGPGFLKVATQSVSVPCHTIPMGDSGLLKAWENSRFLADWHRLHAIQRESSLFLEPTLAYKGYYPYWNWAKALSRHDVTYTCSLPIAAYLSGRPYCFFSVGGDLQFDCGQASDHGMIMRLAVNKARFLLVSNPHTLGHCRRLGFQNAVYVPYAMDSHRYSPAPGRARAEWEAAYGKGVYVLTTSRLDKAVKGHDQTFLKSLLSLARDRPEVRFVFLGWGQDIEEFRRLIAAENLQGRIIVLPPVGKTRLIDYYRSCDVVLDQFVYGYFGATALEAASIGKPVVMKMRSEQYGPLYAGDLAPIDNADGAQAMRAALLKLIDNADYRKRQGESMRAWLVRNHGEEKTVPLMLALLRVAADGVALPSEAAHPLSAPLSPAESAYHDACLHPTP